MSTQNTQYQKRSGRFRPMPSYTPLYGIRLYGSESGYLLTFIAMALYASARVNMSAIELRQSVGTDIIALLSLAASALLAAGGFFVLLGTFIKRLPGIILFTGFLMLIISDGIFGFSVSVDALSELDILGVIQCVFEALFLLSLFILLVAILISCLNRRISPTLGNFPAVMSVFAAVLLIFRTLTTFASLSSALGSSFSWEQTSELATEINWVLRSVAADSNLASDMYYARFFERITLILLHGALMLQVFKFAGFFRQYNTQMQIAAELPDGQHTVYRQSGNPYVSGKFSLLSSLQNLRESEDAVKESSYDNIDDKDSNDSPSELPEDDYCAPDYIAGFDEPEEPFFVQPDSEYEPKSAVEPEPELKQEQPVVIYDTDPLSSGYGMPVEVQSDDEINEPPEQKRIAVKPRPRVPSPNDKNFWNNYAD